MKKFIFLFLIISVPLFLVSCGGDSELGLASEDQPNNDTANSPSNDETSQQGKPPDAVLAPAAAPNADLPKVTDTTTTPNPETVNANPSQSVQIVMTISRDEGTRKYTCKKDDEVIVYIDSEPGLSVPHSHPEKESNEVIKVVCDVQDEDGHVLAHAHWEHDFCHNALEFTLNQHIAEGYTCDIDADETETSVEETNE